MFNECFPLSANPGMESHLVPARVEWAGSLERPASLALQTLCYAERFPYVEDTCRPADSRVCVCVWGGALFLTYACALVQNNTEKVVTEGCLLNERLIPLCGQPFIWVPEHSNSLVNLN